MVLNECQVFFPILIQLNCSNFLIKVESTSSILHRSSTKWNEGKKKYRELFFGNKVDVTLSMSIYIWQWMSFIFDIIFDNDIQLFNFYLVFSMSPGALSKHHHHQPKIFVRRVKVLLTTIVVLLFFAHRKRINVKWDKFVNSIFLRRRRWNFPRIFSHFHLIFTKSSIQMLYWERVDDIEW